MTRPVLGQRAAAVAIFVVLALVWTFPLVLHLGTHVPGAGPGDNLTFVWNFWWMRTALSTGQDFFHTAYLFAPAGVDLVLDTHTALPAFIGATLLKPLPVVMAQNVTLLAALFLNGYCAYRLGFRLTGEQGSSIVAGIIFGGSAYISAHLNGHFNLIEAWTLPLIAMTLADAVGGSLTAAVWTGVLFAATAYIDYYYLVYGLSLAACLVLAEWRTWSVSFLGPSSRVRWLSITLATIVALDLATIIIVATTGGFTTRIGGRRISISGTFNPLQAFWILVACWWWLRSHPVIRTRRRETWHVRNVMRASVVAAGVAMVLAAPILWHGTRLMLAGDYVSQHYLWRTAPGGIDLATIVIGNPQHRLLGQSVLTIYHSFRIDPIESGGWLGFVPLMLVVFCLSTLGSDRIVRLWIVIAAVFFIWSLGPHLMILGWNTGMILPETLLRYIPILSNARIPGRAFVLVSLAVALLGAKALASLRSRVRRPALLTTIATLAIAVELMPAPFPLFQLEHPHIYETLRDRPETGTLCEIPLGAFDGLGAMGYAGTSVLYFQTIHHRPIVGGFLARMPRSITAAYQTDPLIAGLLRLSDPANSPANPMPLPDRAAASALLRQDGIRFVMVNRNLISAELAAYVDHVLPLVRLADEAGRSLFLVEGR